MPKQTRRRAFAIRKWPVFGKGVYDEADPPNTVTSSPYYWWFRFLQLSEAYEKALRGKGARGLHGMAKDLGEVRRVSFKVWWSRVSEQFQEPSSSYDMTVVKSAEDLAPIDDKNAVNLVLPLDWSAMGLKRRFSQIVDSLVRQGRVKPAKRGFPRGMSKANYQIGRRWNTAAMEHAYNLYQCKAEAEAEGERLVWADAAIRAKLPAARGLSERDLSAKASERRVTLTILAKRHYKRAEAYIAASATKRFP